MEHKCNQEQRISDIEDTVSNVSISVLRIEEALLPSKFHPENGVINKVQKIENKVNEMQETLIKAKTWLIAAGAIFGLLLTIAQFIIQILIK
jgi:hypothetical protein